MQRISPLIRARITVFAGLALCCWSTLAKADPYPFEGTWIRADRVCSASATQVRTYSAKDVTSSLAHCTIRRVSSGSGAFELVEECRRNDRNQTVTETIRMSSPDSLVLKRQTSRLKIPRSLRYTRCSAAPAASVHPTRAGTPHSGR